MPLEHGLGGVLVDLRDLEVELEVLLGEVTGYLGEGRSIDPAHDLVRVLGGGLPDLRLAEVAGEVDVVPVLPPPFVPDGPRQAPDYSSISMS